MLFRASFLLQVLTITTASLPLDRDVVAVLPLKNLQFVKDYLQQTKALF